MKQYYLMKKILIALVGAIFTNMALAANCASEQANYDAQQASLQLPYVSVADDSRLFSLQLNLLNTENLLHFQVTELLQRDELLAFDNVVYQQSVGLLSVDALCINGAQPSLQVQLQIVPGSSPAELLVKSIHNDAGVEIFAWPLGANKGAVMLPSRAEFDNLAVIADVAGATAISELKFVLVGVDTANPVLYFMNSKATPLHYDFVRDVLQHFQGVNYTQGVAQFNAETYFRDSRRYLAGSVIAYDAYQSVETDAKQGVFALEFWPTDPVPPALIEQAYHTISAAMPFIETPLVYHPVGTTHEQELLGYAERFSTNNIAVMHTEDLFAQSNTAILNKGEAYGRLQLINPSDPSPGVETIAIYTFVPNTLGHVSGIVTESPQTPLSHINLKARQNDTPNAYWKNAASDPAITALLGSWVHYSVSEAGVVLEAATEVQALQWLADKIPTTTTAPVSDLTLLDPMSLTELGHSDWLRVGVKAANVAELAKILPEGMPPKGYALPFALYDQFMSLPRCIDDMQTLCNDGQSLYAYVEQMLSAPDFKANQQIRVQRLAELRAIIEQAEAPQAMIDLIETVRLFWEPAGEPFSQKLRVRSSTNNEDLPRFNGAGLYDSYTHKPKEGKLINSIKQVWASLWTDRAFEERQIHRIEHLKTYMGVLIHPNYGDEQVNGVAISKNIYNPGWEGLYVNAQYGEISITNPELIEIAGQQVNPISDEFIMTLLPASVSGYAWETQFIRHSNVIEVYGEPVTTENVLLESEMNELRDALTTIHTHFKALYQGDQAFAMDIEFKITETGDGSRGKLAIKQARPWVD
ncbi:MAG: pyruvate, water dikinase [Methyloprofundus sp.]|nr:MAG: pyruvate, water dikinase [Methyloprofundus sp.]